MVVTATMKTLDSQALRYFGGVVYGAIGGELIAEYTKRQ